MKDIKMQKTEVQAIKFVNIYELIAMCEQKIIVDRQPLYDELINYLHKYQKDAFWHPFFLFLITIKTIN